MVPSISISLRTKFKKKKKKVVNIDHFHAKSQCTNHKMMKTENDKMCLSITITPETAILRNVTFTFDLDLADDLDTSRCILMRCLHTKYEPCK